MSVSRKRRRCVERTIASFWLGPEGPPHMRRHLCMGCDLPENCRGLSSSPHHSRHPAVCFYVYVVLCVYVCACLQACMHVYMYLYMYIYMCRQHTCTHMYLHTHKKQYKCTYMYIHIYTLYIHIYRQPYLHAHIYIYTYLHAQKKGI